MDCTIIGVKNHYGGSTYADATIVAWVRNDAGIVLETDSISTTKHGNNTSFDTIRNLIGFMILLILDDSYGEKLNELNVACLFSY